MLPWQQAAVLLAAMGAFLCYDMLYRSRVNYLVLTNEYSDIAMLSHFKPGFTQYLQLHGGVPLTPGNQSLPRYLHAALFTFKVRDRPHNVSSVFAHKTVQSPLLGPFYAKQVPSRPLFEHSNGGPTCHVLALLFCFGFGITNFSAALFRYVERHLIANPSMLTPSYRVH
jgi:hypothetical protein